LKKENAQDEVHSRRDSDADRLRNPKNIAFPPLLFPQSFLVLGGDLPRSPSLGSINLAMEVHYPQDRFIRLRDLHNFRPLAHPPREKARRHPKFTREIPAVSSRYSQESGEEGFIPFGSRRDDICDIIWGLVFFQLLSAELGGVQ
jgi:hypothetical protein